MSDRVKAVCWVACLIAAGSTLSAHAAEYDVWLKPYPSSDQICAQGRFDIDSDEVASAAPLDVIVVYKVTNAAAPCDAFSFGRLGRTFTDNAAVTLAQLPSVGLASTKIKRLSGGSVVTFNGPPQAHHGWQTNGTSGSYLLVNSDVAHIPVAATLPLFLFGIAAIAFSRLCRKASRISS